VYAHRCVDAIEAHECRGTESAGRKLGCRDGG